MNILDVIGKAPELSAGLKSLGLDDSQIQALGAEVGDQLAGADGLDLGDLLGNLDVAGFLERVDIAQVSARLGVDVSTARAALLRIAPHVAAFTAGSGGMVGRLGSLASGLFRKD